MQRLSSKEDAPKAPPLHTSKSFTRYETPKTSSPLRSRAATIHESPPTTEPFPDAITLSVSGPDISNDIFETPKDNGTEGEAAESMDQPPAEGYEQLPIEIQSLMERFLESLALKIHPTPLSIGRLSELYQDFYEHAHTQIGIHIAALATKLSRDASPSPSISSIRSNMSRASARRKPPERRSILDTSAAEHQMLTASEVSNKRKARKLLEVKRLAMEEAIERGVCEKVYPRIWRHQSTDDEARDAKLRSRAAALQVVGVDLKELLSTALSDDTSLNSELEKLSSSGSGPAHARLKEARESLESMNSERFPLGKLERLTESHKHIVEALQQLFPSASSADEVLPTLIYSIITTPPESNSVISNFNFIQRFRAVSKIDGEAAYCLTNLEAAISFLENVDLSSIRSSELPQGPPKSPSQSSTPRTETPDPLYRGLPSNPDELQATSPSRRTSSASTERSRRPSHLRPLDAASGAVLSGADSIHHALDGGFRYLFGRIKERQETLTPVGTSSPSAPKTLEDAHKLVTSEKLADDVDSLDDASLDNDPLSALDSPRKGSGTGERLLDLVGGKSRDRSVDSNKSSGSAGKKVAFSTNPSKNLPAATSSAATAAYNTVESMKNLSSAFNPLRGFSGMTMMRGFGRQAGATVTNGPQLLNVAQPSTSSAIEDVVPVEPLVGTEEAEQVTPFDWSGVSPPMQRFVDCKDARELNFFDVELLLRDYQRLAGAIKASTHNARESK